MGDTTWVIWAAPLGVGALAGLLLTPVARLVAVRTGDIDRPIGQKIHKLPTPLLGGVSVYCAFALTSLLFLPMSAPVRGVLVGGLAAVLVGVVDEYRSLRPLTHLGGQIVAALVAMAAGVGIVHHVSAPSSLASPGFELPALAGFLFTLFWLVGAMNTVNFVDGLDGLAAGIACIAALLLALWARDPHRYLLPVTPHREDLILPLALAGALLGFLPFNWHVAKIFLGDSGSMFLGLAVGALSIIGPAKLGTALLILLVPVLDVAWAIVRRLLRGRNFLQGDKQHVYHRLMELGVSSTQTVLLFYLLCVALAVLDLSLLKIQKIVAFILLAACTIAAFAVIEVRATMRESQRRDRPAL